MSDPQPTAARKSNATKYLFLFLIGLVIGIIGTVMAMRAIDARKDHFPESVMQVQQWHLGQLKDRVTENRCAATDTLPHLQSAAHDDRRPRAGLPGPEGRRAFRDHASKIAARSMPRWPTRR